MIPINKYLTYILLKSFFISFFLFLLLNAIFVNGRNRVFEEKQGDFIESMAVAIWLFALTLSSLTVYFNKFKLVRNKSFFRLLSFFLSPLILSLCTWIFGSKNGEWLSFYLSTALFFVILVFYYFKLSIRYCKVR
jgi:hypothetical protein